LPSALAIAAVLDGLVDRGGLRGRDLMLASSSIPTQPSGAPSNAELRGRRPDQPTSMVWLTIASL